MLGEFSVAAATATLGYDLAQGQVWAQSSRPRTLAGFALTGSTAGGDTKVDLMVDTKKVGEFYNTTTGFPTKDHLMPCRAFVPGGAIIHVYVTDAPASNPINGIVDLKEGTSRPFGGRRYTSAPNRRSYRAIPR